MFIQRKSLGSDEIERYRKMLDPTKKMDDDVFAESCCVENTDMEYVAVKDIDKVLTNDVKVKSTSAFMRWLKSSVPVYVSVFGAKEMTIIINQESLQQHIFEIVLMHCEAK
jgi:hypothetical protein